MEWMVAFYLTLASMLGISLMLLPVLVLAGVVAAMIVSLFRYVKRISAPGLERCS